MCAVATWRVNLAMWTAAAMPSVRLMIDRYSADARTSPTGSHYSQNSLIFNNSLTFRSVGKSCVGKNFIVFNHTTFHTEVHFTDGLLCLVRDNSNFQIHIIGWETSFIFISCKFFNLQNFLNLQMLSSNIFGKSFYRCCLEVYFAFRRQSVLTGSETELNICSTEQGTPASVKSKQNLSPILCTENEFTLSKVSVRVFSWLGLTYSSSRDQNLIYCGKAEQNFYADQRELEKLLSTFSTVYSLAESFSFFKASSWKLGKKNRPLLW